MEKFVASVVPFGLAEEWVFKGLEGDSDNSRIIELIVSMSDTGIPLFKINHYGPQNKISKVIIEDIFLN
jgi:hypothetical protein